MPGPVPLIGEPPPPDDAPPGAAYRTTTDQMARLPSAAADALGGLLGLPRSVLGDLPDWVGRRFGADLGVSDAIGRWQDGQGRPILPTTGQAVEMAHNTLGVPVYQPDGLADRTAQAVLTAGLGGGLGGLRTLPAVLAGGAGSSLAGEGAAALGLPDDWVSAASLAGGAAAGAGVNTAANWAMLRASVPMTPEAEALARLAIGRYGIPLNAGQMLPKGSALRWVYDQAGKLPGGGGLDADRAVRGAWQRAIARTFGEDAEAITPEVMGRAYDRLGGVFDQVANAGIVIDQPGPIVNTLQQLHQQAPQVAAAGDATAVQNLVRGVAQVLQQHNGQLPGDAYLAITGKGTALQRAQASSTPAIRDAANTIRDVLDQSLEAATLRQAPDLAGQLQAARAQYKAAKTVEPLVVKGEPGEISPALLQGRVARQYPDVGRNVTGRPALADLGDIGRSFIAQLPDSTTATRSWWARAGEHLAGPALAVAGLGGHMPPMGALALGAAGVPASIGANYLLTRYLRTPLARQLVLNRQAAQPFPAAPMAAGAATSLLPPQPTD